MTDINIGEGTIHVRDTGSGDKPTLLFVHGIMMDGSVWDKQTRKFKDTHRCVCVDLRGFGQSPTDDPNISFEDHADDMAALIDAMNLSEVTWVGWSMGGAIAMIFVTRHPNKVERLVLVDTTPQLLADENFPHALPPEAAQQLGGLLVENYDQGCKAFAGLVAPEDKRAQERIARIAAASSPPVSLTAFQTSGSRNQIEELEHVDVPTTIIHGREDGVCLPAAAEFMAQRVRQATGPVWIEGAGHAGFMTKPDEFNAALRSALRTS